MKMMSGSSSCALTIALVSPTPSQEAAIERLGTFVNQIAAGQPGRAMGLAHLWWEHVLGHLEATMLGQLGGRMKMMPGGPKLCSHHRLAGPSWALQEGDHTMGGVGGGY